MLRISGLSIGRLPERQSYKILLVQSVLQVQNRSSHKLGLEPPRLKICPAQERIVNQHMAVEESGHRK